jgi:acetyl esterase/lipase
MSAARLPVVVAWALALALALAACGDLVVEHDISYDDRHGAATTFDVYRPPASAGVGPFPAVLVIHGGGWSAGSRGDLAAAAARLAGAGYVTINLDYRLVPDGVYPNAPSDCLCALSYVRAQAARWAIDPTRIAALGYSAGGHLVSLLGVAADDPRLAGCPSGPTGPVAAVVSGAGPQDLRTLGQGLGVGADFLGGTPGEVPDVYVAASPVTHVHAGAPPFLFIHGEADWFVPIAQSRQMAAALLAVGTPATLLTLPGGGHVWNRGVDGDTWQLVLTSTDTPEAWAAIVDFLDHTIGGAR